MWQLGGCKTFALGVNIAAGWLGMHHVDESQKLNSSFVDAGANWMGAQCEDG